jgi:uncharacterized protein (TIGR03032 family)
VLQCRPPLLVTALAADDGCPLNGLTLVDGQAKYVTALGETNTATGWRANKPQGDCLMEVSSGERISRGLSMLHSPRWQDGRLWLLESGTGQLVLVDPATGRRQSVVELTGFARGLALSGPYAFVGLSKIRKTSALDGVPFRPIDRDAPLMSPGAPPSNARRSETPQSIVRGFPTP